MAGKYQMTQNRRHRFSKIIHVLHGLLAGLLWWVDRYVSIFLFVQFCLYEWVEENKVKDEMYYELREWAVGFAVGLLGMLGMGLLFRFF